MIYGNVLSVREKEYVESARAIGTKNLDIIIKYVLPNSFTPVLIAMTFRTAQAIIMESCPQFSGHGGTAATGVLGQYDVRRAVYYCAV